MKRKNSDPTFFDIMNTTHIVRFFALIVLVVSSCVLIASPSLLIYYIVGFSEDYPLILALVYGVPSVTYIFLLVVWDISRP